MVAILFLATFLVALATSLLVVAIFTKPIDAILHRVVPAEISHAWTRYLQFAIVVVGIGGGVRVWDFEKYMIAMEPYNAIVELTPDRWVLEMYATVIGTLQSTTMVLLVFFVFALIAVVLARIFDLRAAKPESTGKQSNVLTV